MNWLHRITIGHITALFRDYPFRYIATIFLSAFLLFQVQPMIAKSILPWFGGTPAVWTTCMLFFQVLLLVGYAYAHLTSACLKPATQTTLHVGLLVASLVFLPIIPDEFWKPAGDENPVTRILLLLGATIGLPYVVLSTTGPLMQRWFSLTNPGQSPYRLFALSNAGSLAALLSYPFVFEPNLTLSIQAYSWSWGFVLFGVSCATCAWYVFSFNSRTSTTVKIDATADKDSLVDLSPAVGSGTVAHETRPPSLGDMLTWIGLSAAPSILLLATTNQMCQEVAVVPFLWIVPLSLYLVTFIVCFDSERWYHRPTFLGMSLLSAGLVWYCMENSRDIAILYQVAAYCLGLFACCMVCHGELSKSKPSPQHLTLFFLLISAGGAIGGLFVVIIAPRVFDQYWEIHAAYTACFFFMMLAYWRAKDWHLFNGEPLWAWGILVSIVSMIITFFWMNAVNESVNVIYRSRDFYGVLTIWTHEDTGYITEAYNYGDYKSLRHGATLHGTQYTSESSRRDKTSYYANQSGVGIAVRFNPKQFTWLGWFAEELNIGIVGLGSGTMAAYGEAGDRIRFYEINPEVVRLSGGQVGEGHQIVTQFSTGQFTFLKDCQDRGCKTDVVLGDARIQMERQLARGERQGFDVLVVDAFSSDSIPMHLLTLDCFKLYLEHLDANGILAVHVSNRYLRLEPIVRNLARVTNRKAIWIDWSAPENENGEVDPSPSASNWILVTNNEEFLNSPLVAPHIEPFEKNPLPDLIWTDDFGSLWQIMR